MVYTIDAFGWKRWRSVSFLIALETNPPRICFLPANSIKVPGYISLSHRLKKKRYLWNAERSSRQIFPRKKKRLENCEPNNNPPSSVYSRESIWESGPVSRYSPRVALPMNGPIRCENRCTVESIVASLRPRYLIVCESRWIRISGQRVSAETLNR